MSGITKGTIFAVLAGLTGAALWAVISWKANSEWGILAWGIGFAVGFAMHFGAQEERSSATGILAALIAVAAIVLGKYGAVAAMQHTMNANVVQSITEGTNAESMVLDYAYELAVEIEENGKPVAWRNGIQSSDDAESITDFPPDIQKKANDRWSALTPEEQEQAIATARDESLKSWKDFSSTLTVSAFLQSFGLFDILWGFLAIMSAYRLGVGDINA
ncbi:MAG: hypothetical protein IPK69_13385 [Phycisphaerales bacterium]|nr:MAG: hypothetical protein IPK69_13385 [Phycisphaerales bacterium]